jgi:hypothetical protein
MKHTSDKRFPEFEPGENNFKNRVLLSPGLQKPDHGKRATVAASFAQRPSHEPGTLVADQPPALRLSR